MSVNQVQPKLIIHGGAGGHIKSDQGEAMVRQALSEIVTKVYQLLTDGGSAVDAVVLGCQLMENQPTFNAGTGSVLQSDGQIRMSAALMDGAKQRFSGIINVSRVQHPIDKNSESEAPNAKPDRSELLFLNSESNAVGPRRLWIR